MKKPVAQSHIPTWPRERDLATYTRYSAIDFASLLTDGKTWIDIGCRTGKALHDSKAFCTAKLLGINAHQIEVLPGIEAIFTAIPKDLFVLNNYRAKADLLTDVYGAFTYDNDPIAVLIYEALLLKPNATAVIISLEPKFGNRVNRHDLQLFFDAVMGQTINIRRFRTYTDNTKRPLNSLRITITGSCQAKCTLDKLLEMARDLVGEPKKVRIAYRPQDQSCEVWKILYKKRKNYV